MKLVDIEPYKGKVIASHTYCGVNKLIEVDALEGISEKEIVKPYLDKIRAEIEMYEADCRLQGGIDECEKCNSNVFGSVYRIIDKYKAESEGKE